MDTDPPVSRPHRGEARRADLGERIADVPPMDYRRELLGLEESYRTAVEKIPPRYRDWLSRLAQAELDEVRQRVERYAAGQLLNGTPIPSWLDVPRLIREIERDGAAAVVLRHWRSDDYQRVVPMSLAVETVRAVIEAGDGEAGDGEAGDEVLALAVSEAARLTGLSQAERIRLLLLVMERDHVQAYVAAAHLIDLTPDTPGVVEVLLEAVTQSDEVPDTGEFGRSGYGYSCSYSSPLLVADLAVRALMPRSPALDAGRLRAALAAFGGADRMLAFHLWWYATGALDGCPLSLPAVIQTNPDDWFAFWRLEGRAAGIDPRLTALTIRAATYRLADFGAEADAIRDAIGDVAEADLPAGDVLPMLAKLHVLLLRAPSALEDAEVRAAEMHIAVKTCQEMFLRNLPGRRAAWTEWDTWVATLLGQPLGGADWLVFADWLDEHDEPDAAKWIRADAEGNPSQVPSGEYGYGYGHLDPALGWGDVFRWLSAAEPLRE